MKQRLILALLCISQICFAQSSSGIYLNWQDYSNHKLSYSGYCGTASDNIRLNHFFSKGYIEVKQDGKKTKLGKDQVFGYRDCKQKDYRFYKSNDREYRIVEIGPVVIYIANLPVTISTGKTVQLVPYHFFSKDLQSDILPLTAINLKQVFPDNIKFPDKPNVQLNSVLDAYAYDDAHKMYKVNFLLRQSNSN